MGLVNTLFDGEFCRGGATDGDLLWGISGIGLGLKGLRRPKIDGFDGCDGCDGCCDSCCDGCDGCDGCFWFLKKPKHHRPEKAFYIIYHL